MEKKLIIIDEPNIGDVSVYNFDENYNTESINYYDSIGLPLNNDKFQNKDLYTKSVGSDVNNAIIERNLKAQGGGGSSNFIRIDSLYVSAYASPKPTKNNRVEGYLFSEEDAYITPGIGYSALKSIVGADSFRRRFFVQNFSNLNGGDLGNVTHVEGKNILFNFSAAADGPEFGDFDGRNTGFSGGDEYQDGNGPFTENFPLKDEGGLSTKIFDENINNAIYLVIRLRGDEDPWIGTDVRKRKYQVYKIDNLELFDVQGSEVSGKISYFDSETNLPKIVDVEGDGGGYDDEKPAWTVTDLKISISTIDAIPNNWAGEVDEILSDEENYVQFFESVQPTYFISNFLSDVDLLSINFDRQLSNNTNPPGPEDNQNSIYPNFIPKTIVSTLDTDNNLKTEIDLQSYYENDLQKSLIASAPATIGLSFKAMTENNFDIDTIKFYYFVIDWNDIEDKIKTLDDWLKIRPSELQDLQILKDTENIYKIFSNENNEFVTNTYTTPGIKNIKSIMISFDETTRQLGRWKLVTTKIFLDIPINQYPDFGELGGTNYTTLPWPYTTAIIGGIDKDSKYYQSILNTLGGGKIGDTDIIDEKFLINARENDELGSSIEKLDLEQCRYFNKQYSIYDLLNIEAVQDNQLISYNEYDGETSDRTFPMESSIGQIFINDNQDMELKKNCKMEINTSELTNNSIYDSSGNSNKGLLIGDYKIKKNRKGEPMRRDTFIKVPKKTRKNDGAM